MITIKFKPRKGFKNVKQHLQRLNGAKAEWGIYQSSGMHPTAKMPKSQLMAIHELRTDRWRRPVFSISALRFQRRHFFNMAKELEKFVTIAARGRYKTVDSALLPVAAAGAETAKSIFGNKKFLVPNTARTKAKKGHSKPLVDLGALKGAVKFKVKKKGQK